MPIITCINPNIPEGYNPNSYGDQDGLFQKHIEVAHEVTYVDCVIATFERNMYDDSDFCAIVFDKEQSKIRTITYATTRGWTYHNHAAIDATEEVIAAAEAILIADLTERYISEWSTPSVGKRVRSKTTKGRYVGCEGVLSEIRDSDFSRYQKVGVFKVDNFADYRYPATVNLDRLEVVDPLDKEACFQRASKLVKAHGIVSVVRRAQFGA
ncbi:hypothetical protein SEA_YARA_85 [Streptomyces phage Yara]|nr:hypothetical protein SEA_YARA_85 [Streptomyces phage Yara]